MYTYTSSRTTVIGLSELHNVIYCPSLHAMGCTQCDNAMHVDLEIDLYNACEESK